jgi:hypothetical protein
VGESGRAHLWKRRICDYWNADVELDDLGHVDCLVDDLVSAVEDPDNFRRRPWVSRAGCDSPAGADAAILSYVLSAIPTDRSRLRLLRRLHHVTNETAALILFDDLQLNVSRHRRLRVGSYFHMVRLGRGILSLLSQAGWQSRVIDSYPDTRLLANAELPFILARKGALREANA